MPHLVQMHKKFAGNGLVVITLSIDTPTEKQEVREANDFLVSEKIPFRNLLLNEAKDFWKTKFDIIMPPCYYVFDRRGKWVRLRTEDFAKDEDLHAQLDKVVERMLSEK